MRRSIEGTLKATHLKNDAPKDDAPSVRHQASPQSQPRVHRGEFRIRAAGARPLALSPAIRKAP
jgi:hypothetical protein